MTLTNEYDLDWVKLNSLNHRAEYLGQRSFRSKVIMRTHRHTHSGPTARPGPLKWSVISSITCKLSDSSSRWTSERGLKDRIARLSHLTHVLST